MPGQIPTRDKPNAQNGHFTMVTIAGKNIEERADFRSSGCDMMKWKQMSGITK